MLHLNSDDRRDLVNLLKDLPELASEQARRQMLELAGLKQLTSMIDVSGPPFIAVNQIVSYLSNYGRLTYEQEALGLFLNLLKSFVGCEQREFLDKLLTEYDMMIPIAPIPIVRKWQGKETVAQVLEKIIGENTLRPIAFLAKGLQASRSVAYIGVCTGTQRWSGTGFLVAADLLLTNHHVIPSAEFLPSALFRFNYEENIRGEAQVSHEYRARPNGIFRTNEELDYALIQVDDEPGKEWGWLPLRAQQVRQGDRVNIIQHPNGQPKQVSLQNNFVEYVGGNVVQYVTSTLPGSSGSPVLNDNWDVVAIHHAGGDMPEPTTSRKYFRNEGVVINVILTDLSLELRQLIDVASA